MVVILIGAYAILLPLEIRFLNSYEFPPPREENNRHAPSTWEFYKDHVCIRCGHAGQVNRKIWADSPKFDDAEEAECQICRFTWWYIPRDIVEIALIDNIGRKVSIDPDDIVNIQRLKDKRCRVTMLHGYDYEMSKK